MSIRAALGRDNLLCYELNGEPFPPSRLPLAPDCSRIVRRGQRPRIEVRDQRYANRFMVRDDLSMREEQRGAGSSVLEPIRLKSAPGHVARRANRHYTIKKRRMGRSDCSGASANR
jgi:hypothetical protein